MSSVGISNVDSVLAFSGWFIGLNASILIWFLKADPILIGLIFMGVIFAGALVIAFCLYCVKLELKRGVLVLESVRVNKEPISGYKIVPVKNLFSYCELTLQNGVKFVVAYGQECGNVASELSELVGGATNVCEESWI